MAYLNKEQREDLLNELKDLKFHAAKHKLMRMDPQRNMRYYRNNQRTGQWITRIDLVGMGTIVYLIEVKDISKEGGEHYADYILDEIIVEPTPDNNS